MGDSENNISYMPADIAVAIEDLQPDIKARIEKVFKFYNDSEGISSSLNKLNEFFNDFENVCGKYKEVKALKEKLTSICKDNNITLNTNYDSHKCYNFNIGNLININVHTTTEPPFTRELLDYFTISYIGNNNEHKEKVIQICELLMNEL